MTEAGLKTISNDMDALGINYGLLEGEAGPVYPYFVGEYQEIPSAGESGEEETNFTLVGFSRGEHLVLEKERKKIKKYYPEVGGRTVTAEDGTVVAIFYSNSFIVPTGDMELKRIEINLTIKEWSVK